VCKSSIHGSPEPKVPEENRYALHGRFGTGGRWGYVASVPALPGCISQGDNRAEALKNISEAVKLYIEDCHDAGDPVPAGTGKEFVEIEAA
jgi:predicted RNase H-like HicB family nuclease